MASKAYLSLAVLIRNLMPKKKNKKQSDDNGGPVVVIMLITLALLLFFVVYWQKSLLKVFGGDQSHWKKIERTQISPRD